MERLVDDFDDRAAQPVAGEVQATEPAKRGLGVRGVPVGRLRDPLDPDVRADPERNQQLAPPGGDRVGDLPRDDRGQLRGEVGQVVRVLEHGEQVEHPVSSFEDCHSLELTWLPIGQLRYLRAVIAAPGG